MEIFGLTILKCVQNMQMVCTICSDLSVPILKNLYGTYLKYRACDKFCVISYSSSDARTGGSGFDTWSGHIISFLLQLMQEGQFSVTGESMGTEYWLTA